MSVVHRTLIQKDNKSLENEDESFIREINKDVRTAIENDWESPATKRQRQYILWLKTSQSGLTMKIIWQNTMQNFSAIL